MNPRSRGVMGDTAASRHMKGHGKVMRWKSNSLSAAQSTGSPGATRGRLKLHEKKTCLAERAGKRWKSWPGEVFKTRRDTLPGRGEVELLLPGAGMDWLSPEPS